MPQTEVQPEREPSPKLEACLALLLKINWARRAGKRDMADKLLKELHLIEGKR
jgi:hypothetical protein